MRLALLLPLVAGLGCAGSGTSSADLNWQTLDQAFEKTQSSERPVLVLSVMGDIRKRC